MLTLYVKTGCPYCAKVLKAVRENNIPIEEKNIADPGVSDELVALGGRRQTPFLVDHEHNVSLYESKAIVDYLCEHYGCSAEDLSDVALHVCPI